MKKLVVLSIGLLLSIALVGSMTLGGETGRTVTLKGTIACAKCSLHVDGQAECHNVLIVGKEGKQEQFYMTKNEVYEEFGSVCKTTPAVRVTGKLVAKDGQTWITPSEITVVNEEG